VQQREWEEHAVSGVKKKEKLGKKGGVSGFKKNGICGGRKGLG